MLDSQELELQALWAAQHGSSAGVISPAQILCLNTLILEAGVWLNSGALAGIHKAIGSICSTEKN